MKKKIKYLELGFPVFLVGFETRKVRGVEVPEVNLNKLMTAVFEALVAKPTAFTGGEIKFIRSYLRLNQNEFGKMLNHKGHSRVSQWEKRGEQVTLMDKNTELILRLKMAQTISSEEAIKSIKDLDSIASTLDGEPQPIVIDSKKAA